MSGPREFLALLDDGDRRALDELGTMRRATRGEVFVFEGQVADKVVAISTRCFFVSLEVGAERKA
jgi:hypothetical protein